MIKRYFEFIKESPDFNIQYSSKPFKNEWKGGIITGELPTNDWLEILCESLDDEVEIEILEHRFYDIGGRLVHEADAHYILNNKVYICKELVMCRGYDTYDPLMKQRRIPLIESDKMAIHKIEKKIQLEGYDTLSYYVFGQSKILIYPKEQKPAGFKLA